MIGGPRSVDLAEPAPDLRRGRVGQCGSVAKEHGRHGQIAVVDLSHNRCGIGMMVDVDLVEGDSSAIQLGLEPYAVAAPARGEEGWPVCGYQIHSHDMYNWA